MSGQQREATSPVQHQHAMQIALENVEAVVKQLRSRPRQTLEEIVEATRLSREKILLALILLNSRDRELIVTTTYSLGAIESFRNRDEPPARRTGWRYPTIAKLQGQRGSQRRQTSVRPAP
jgi:hypothetical protein